MANPKYPRYVTVYDVLLKDIQSGRYQVGEKLPGENELAKSFNVSRNTLRQALLLLNEDGYISMRQGKGTLVLRDQTERGRELDSLNDPLVSLAVDRVDRVETQIEIRKISPLNQEIFGLDASKLLVLVKTTCVCGEDRVGCGLSFIPYDIFAERRIPLDNMERIRAFYLELLARESLDTATHLRVVEARDLVAQLLGVSSRQTLVMLDEEIHDKKGGVLLTQKLFFLPNRYDFTFTRRNERMGGGTP